MSLRALFRRLLGRGDAAPVPYLDSDDRPGNVSGASGLEERWVAAFEAGQLEPPADVHSPGAWDEYWRTQLKVGALEQRFADWMSSDATLPPLLAGRGVRTILCAGNGLSNEAIALTVHGFNVTALDISAVPGQLFGAMLRDAERPIHRIPGFSSRDDGSVVFSATSTIDPELCPPIHRSADYPPRGGGSLLYVTGDLMDPQVFPGPFDAVVERRTLQLFPATERLAALDRLVKRLSNRGVFVSQQHVGCWKPGDDRTHYAESWLTSRGFVIASRKAPRESGAARLACLTFSSG
jgi:hypothetical protein